MELAQMPSGAHSIVVSPYLERAAARVTESRPSLRSAATYYPAFDWMRISLALMVMLHHADLFPWGRLGHFRVQVFFALSGWLIGRILLRTSRADLPRFYFGRVIRIWIPYLLALALLIALSLLRQPITPRFLEFVLYKLTFVYNLFGTSQLASAQHEMPLFGTGNHFWSICAEEQFYLFAPLLLLVLPRGLGRSPWLWLALAGSGLFSSISLGVAASLAHARWGALHLQPRVRLGLLVTLACGVTLLCVFDGWYNQLVPLIAISIVLLLARPGAKTELGEFFGGMSYQLYLNHWIGLFVAHAVAERLGIRPIAATLLLGFPLSFTLAALLYVLVDKRALARRELWYTPARARVAMIAAYATTSVGLLAGALIALAR
ncbi:MAG TPA: acyltransferase [Polyangiales bacterium]|nr:acyltransferase [Polyangiales bacterium]